MRTFWNELRFGLRLLRKAPGAAAVSMLALGLGIGANTAIFSVANGILLHPLPYAHSERLLFLASVAPHDPPDAANPVSAPNYLDWKAQTTVFEAMTAFHFVQDNLSGAGAPVVALGAQVAANFFQVLPSRPILGRTFLPGEDQPGREREILLSQALWQHQYAANPAIVGQTIQLNQQAYTVVGVMGADAVEPQGASYWTPLAFTPQQANDHGSHYVRVIGELKPGATQAQAAAELNTITQRLDAQYPATDQGWGSYVETYGERIIGQGTANYVFLLLGAVGFLLLIACANVANLQFARALGRNHELAIRSALGAGRGRILRQLLTENLLLGLGGAVVGTGFAWVAIRLILAYMPADIARFIGGWDRVRLDGVTLGYTLAIGIAAGILAGIAPAWHAARPDLNATLKEGGRGAVGHSRRRLRSALVVAQVALAIVLLVGAALMVRGFQAKLAPAQAYDPKAVLTAAINLNTPKYKDPNARRALYEQTLARLNAMPGVRGVGMMSLLPLGNNESESPISIEGHPIADASQVRYAAVQSITPNALALLHIPLLRGRSFTASDGNGAPAVALVSQFFAARYWPGQDALGQRIKLGRDDSASPWMTIVGVVPEIALNWGDNEPEPAVYTPLEQNPQNGGFFLLRQAGAGDVTALAAGARAAVAAADAAQPLGDIKSLAEVIHDSTIGLAYVSVMLTVVGILALVLAGIGLYGIMAFLVGERAHEIGVRRALGASNGAVLELIVRGGAVLLAWGFALGLPLAFFIARMLQSLIVGISAHNLATYAGISAVLLLMAALACLVPAQQALRVDPLVALREP